MYENGEQDNHVIRHYFKVSGHMKGHAMGDHHASKHSYFLRAKTPRFHKELVPNNERSSSPTRSPGSKSEHFDELYPASSEEEDLANCLVMLSNKSHALSSDHKEEENKGKQVVEKGMFQCKACKKIFNSHQALGGHRASHKKVKGCFAAKLDGGDEEIDPVQEEREPAIPSGSDPARSASTSKRPKMHECSVCRRVFSSGQALGGHKRCHWLTTSSSTTTDNAFIPSFQDFQYDHQQQLCTKPMFMKPRDEQDHQLDLNLNLPVVDNTSRFEASTRLYLQQQRIPNTNANANTNTNTGNDNGQMGREVNKIRKLSDLRDVNYDGGWLQMGIASTADIY